MATSAIFGERYQSKVSGIFDAEEAARGAARDVVEATTVTQDRVKVVGPGDPQAARKVEPESLGIAYTLVKSHISLGVLGVVAGLLIALVLLLVGVSPFAASPYYTIGVAMAFGGIGGLILGGLVSIRPDDTRLMAAVRRATGEGRWAVVVHARNAEEKRDSAAVLERLADESRRTL